MNPAALAMPAQGMGDDLMAMGAEFGPPEPEYKIASLKDLIAWLEDAEEATDSSRALAERDRDYYDHKQLTADQIRVLRKRRQPEIVIPRVQAKVNFLLGYEASQRTDPRGFPRTPDDEEAADACTDALRYTKDVTGLDMSASQVWENMLVEGFGGLEALVETELDGDADVEIKRHHWDRLWYDAHSREHDFTDAKHLGSLVWLDADSAVALYAHVPDIETIINQTVSDDRSRTYGDRPHWKQWATSGARKRVRIVQCYYKCAPVGGGKECWHWAIYTKGGIIEQGRVPYVDERGRSLCPMILQAAFVNRNNERYGIVRAMIGAQDEINSRRSKMLHEASVRQFLYEDGALDDVELTKAELAKADGAVKVVPGFKFEMVDRSKEIAAHSALQQEAKQEIEQMGPNAAMLGKGPDASGRSKLVDQQGGQIEIAVLLDRHRHFKHRVYKLIWAIIRQYWTAQKWLRVTDDQDNIKFVGLNRPVTLAEDLIAEAVRKGIDAEDAKAVLRNKARDPNLAQQLQQVVRYENVPAEMDMDIILDPVPDTANVQQEQFGIIGDVAKAVPLPPTLAVRLVVEASALRADKKKRILSAIDEEEAKQKQAQQQDPVQSAAAQLTLEKAMTEIEKLRAEVGQIKAGTIETLAKADSYDKSFGEVADPRVTRGGGSQPRPAPQQNSVAA